MTLEDIRTQHEDSTTVCHLAGDAQSRQRVYQLRHCCYMRKGAIDPRPDQQFSDSFDERENSFSFLLSSAKKALATVRISVVRPEIGWDDAPARHVFGDHPAFQAMASESYVEASRLCFGEQARRSVLMMLLGNMAALADFYEVGWLVACPRVEHAPIYERLFGFRVMAPPRQYFGVKFETQLLGVRREEIRKYVQDIKPMSRAWTDALAHLSQPGLLPITSFLA